MCVCVRARACVRACVVALQLTISYIAVALLFIPEVFIPAILLTQLFTANLFLLLVFGHRYGCIGRLMLRMS